MKNEEESLLVPERPDKMYVIVRQDLSRAYQIPQSIHAKDEFTHKYPKIEKKWHEESNTLAVLGVEDKEELLELVGKIHVAKLKFALFFEPDIDEHTAVAVEPGPRASELLAHLKPAGYNRKKRRRRRRRKRR